MTSLDRAVPLSKMHHIAVIIRKHLHLYVPVRMNEFFYIDVLIPEKSFGLFFDPFESPCHVLFMYNTFHAHAAPACRGLDDYRIAYRARNVQCFFFVLERAP